MIKPARATRDLFGSLSDEERATAICLAREKQLQAKSPVLKAARMITFRDGCWRLDGVPWEDVVRAGVSLVSPLVQAPEWVDKDDFTCVLKSDEALHDALTTSAVAGLVRNAENLIKRLAGSASDSVSLRAISMCRQQYSKISLPVPALDGGLGSDQLAAYKRDWDVYRLLALIARLAPGALRPVMPPNFAVVDANLLRIVERWMARGMRCKETKVGAGSGWNNNPLWRGMVDAEARLMEHQRCAIASMRRRDSDADTGHFLIMDTGVGKTITSLCYLYRWLVKNGKGVINRIIWVTPKGTVDNLVKQLRGTWSAPVWNVPRLSKAKKPKNGTGDSLLLKDYHVNVIHADHLRDMIDSGLSEIAPTSVIGASLNGVIKKLSYPLSSTHLTFSIQFLQYSTRSMRCTLRRFALLQHEDWHSSVRSLLHRLQLLCGKTKASFWPGWQIHVPFQLIVIIFLLRQVVWSQYSLSLELPVRKTCCWSR